MPAMRLFSAPQLNPASETGWRKRWFDIIYRSDTPPSRRFDLLLVYAIVATGIGLVASSVTNSQSAAMFIALVVTMVPAVQFSGLLHPVTSLEGAGRLIGEIFPSTYMLIISRGVFSKALGLHELGAALVPLLLTVPVVMGAAVALLKKQEA